MLKKRVTPNARSTENMHFGGYFIENNFQYSCAVDTQKSLDYFCDSLCFTKKFYDPSFFMTPSIPKKMMAPNYRSFAGSTDLKLILVKIKINDMTDSNH